MQVIYQAKQSKIWHLQYDNLEMKEYLLDVEGNRNTETSQFIFKASVSKRSLNWGVSRDFQIYGRHIVMTSPGYKLLRQLHFAHPADKLS